MTVDRVDPDKGSQSGEVEQRGPVSNGEVVLPQPTSRLQQFAVDARAAYTVAQSIAKTTFVPTAYKARGRGQNRTYLPPEEVAQNVTAAFLAGDELGLKPMQSLQAINLIEGTPALSAQAMRALVQGAGHEVWIEEQAQPGANAQQVFATVAGRRSGSDHVERSTWTWQRARQNELTGKDNWQRDPLAMCVARATSAVCRLIASDVLMGLAYSVEELTDDPDLVSTSTEESARPPGPSVQRKSAQQQEAETPAESPETPSDSAGTPDGTATLASPVQRAQGAYTHTGEGGSSPENGVEHAGLCGAPRQDHKAFCDRPAGHPERHRYVLDAPPDAFGERGGQQDGPTPVAPEEPAAQPEPVSDADTRAFPPEGEPDGEPDEGELQFPGWSSDDQASEEPPESPQDTAIGAVGGEDPADDPWADFK